MDYEKAYKDALERARGIHKFSSDIAEIKRMEQIFPELAEREDEKIRKAQLDFWRSVGGKEWHGVPVQEAIAWLEKQSPVGWRKEDDMIFNELYDFLINKKTVLQRDCNIYAHWLKSLKQRMEEKS